MPSATRSGVGHGERRPRPELERPDVRYAPYSADRTVISLVQCGNTCGTAWTPVIPRAIEPARYLLPPAAYWSGAWAERERVGLFDDRWALVASLDELTRPGDYATAMVGSSPVVVVRDGDGTLRAFHNLCRHRGMRLLQGSGTAARTIECFYHGWRYGLDGSLRVVPQRR